MLYAAVATAVGLVALGVAWLDADQGARAPDPADGAGAAAKGPVPQAVPAPPGAETDFRWYRVPLLAGGAVLIGVTGSGTVDAPQPGVLLLPGSDGLRPTYQEAARRLAGNGFVVGVSCWFERRPAVTDDSVPCDEAPEFAGITTGATAVVDALVGALRSVPGVDPARVGVVGHSRGGGLAVLWSATGAARSSRVPVVSSAGLVSAPLDPPDDGIMDELAVEHVRAVTGAVLLVHGTADGLVPIEQSYELAAALQARGRPPTTVWLAGADHDVLELVVVDAWVTAIAGFLHAQLPAR